MHSQTTQRGPKEGVSYIRELQGGHGGHPHGSTDGVVSGTTSNLYHEGDPNKIYWVLSPNMDPVACYQAVEFANNLRHSTFSSELHDLPCFSTPASVCWDCDGSPVNGVAVAVCVQEGLGPASSAPACATKKVIAVFRAEDNPDWRLAPLHALRPPSGRHVFVRHRPA
jgi:hypothetical protein